MLALGIIIGILLCLVIISVEFYLKKSILNRIEKKVQSLRKETGAIISLPSDEDRAISEIIQKNNNLGQDTKIEELQ